MPVNLPKGTLKKDLTKEFFNKYFCYKESTGDLLWKPREIHDFANESASRVWHKRYSLKPAGGVSKPSNGYSKIQITFAGQTFSAHRIVAVMIGIIDRYGHSSEIDHIDGDTTNNKAQNLRLASTLVNQRNKKRNSRGKNKANGIYWNSSAKKYQVTIGRGPGRSKQLGYFEDFFEAVCARKSAELELGYTFDHGNRL